MDIQVRFRANTTLRRMLVRPKDPVPPVEQVGVIYKIPCMDCTKAYIGQSGRTLAMRLKEHQRAVQNGDVNASAIAEHIWHDQHRIDWSAAEIVDSERYLCPKLMLESWHIHSEQDPLNRERGSLPIEYCSLIKWFLYHLPHPPPFFILSMRGHAYSYYGLFTVTYLTPCYSHFSSFPDDGVCVVAKTSE